MICHQKNILKNTKQLFDNFTDSVDEVFYCLLTILVLMSVVIHSYFLIPQDPLPPYFYHYTTSFFVC